MIDYVIYIGWRRGPNAPLEWGRWEETAEVSSDPEKIAERIVNSYSEQVVVERVEVWEDAHVGSNRWRRELFGVRRRGVWALTSPEWCRK